MDGSPWRWWTPPCGRVLRSKFQVGLFENPYVDEGSGRGRIRYSHGPGPRTTSGRGVDSILLQNRGDLLPLDADALRSVAVIGPAADDPRFLQGDYHYPAHLEIMYQRPDAQPKR